MARKPAGQLSEAYAKRLARAEARGLSRQQARGHRSGEHIVRAMGGAKALTPHQVRDAERLAAAVKGKRGAARAAAAADEARKARRREAERQRHGRQVEREKWTGQLTAKDRRYARMIGKRWLPKLQHDFPGMTALEAAQLGEDRMGRVGPERFRAAVAHNRAMYRQYKQEIKSQTYESRGEELLDMLAADDDEASKCWYFYHSYS